MERIRTHPVRQPAFWQALRARPLDERILPGPPAMVEFLDLDVRVNKIPARPRPVAADDEMLQVLRQAVVDLPPAIRKMLDARLAGVFLVRDFGGTGIADSVRWDAREGLGFIVLDPDALRRRVANEWASWKENTPFRDDSAWRIEAVIAAPGDNLRLRAVQYILLHEIAHVLATRDAVHPNWAEPPGGPVPAGRYPFFDLAWHWDAPSKSYRTRFDAAWPDRSRVRYYFGAQLGGKDMLPAYRWLQSTNFPSLYAATHPGDDFAESFASYVHAVLLRRPWEVRIFEGERLALTLPACWNQPRCAEKRRVLESLLASFEQEGRPAQQ